MFRRDNGAPRQGLTGPRIQTDGGKDRRRIAMNGTVYCLDVLASKTELEQIAKLLTDPNNSAPYDRETQKDRRNHFSKFGYMIGDGLREVSEKFPNAIFLLEEMDGQYCCSQRTVIRDGTVIRSAFDDRPAQMWNWEPLNIFTPFECEFYNDMPFGSMWEQFLSEAEAQIKLQRARMEEEKQNQLEVQKNGRDPVTM